MSDRGRGRFPKADLTPELVATVHQMRREGATGAVTAEAIGYSQFIVRKALKLPDPCAPVVPPAAATKPPAPPKRDLNDGPLPAGHPVSWGSIVAGTLLDGEEYPMDGWPSVTRVFGAVAHE